MQSVNGTVTGFLRDTVGHVNGFVLDGELEIRFSADQLDLIAAIVTLGSRIEIGGDVQYSNDEQRVLSAAYITNLHSNRTTSLPAPVCLGKPGMLSDGAPNRAASLAHHHMEEEERPSGSGSQTETTPDIIDLFLEKVASEVGQSRHAPNEHSHQHLLPLPRAKKSDAAAEIEHAYDRLHRIQAILAYLNIMKRQVHGISQMHEEAKHTYEQALAQYGAQEFEGAREFATASRCLSRIVEGVISRTVRSDTTYPSLVPPPPEHAGTCGDSTRVQDDLNEVAAVLSRIHWVLENGTLPLEDRAQVRRIAAWSDAFYQQARRMYQRGLEEDAIEFAQAASAAADSAEHVCRNWYVAQVANSQNHMVPADHSATA
jgi:hypothetical protein